MWMVVLTPAAGRRKGCQARPAFGLSWSPLHSALANNHLTPSGLGAK